ncbi:MAG: coproporphyrinogen III oxidase family protein [Syntrophorhabdaceae bacterium]|nr:coproporphyrinogen III oxidase family protein [Syntrophorhabdaceae bacterium]MDD4196021.1 coproporphyrinogen III oxidase family protein [Syntrophorhabdaceae bacterium]
MLVEKLICNVARKKNADYLRFRPGESYDVPRPRDAIPRLLYLHVPFCEELCPYCSFNRVVFREQVARDYFRALRKEISMYGDLGYSFNAIYVGGGTPTVLIDELAQTLNLAKGIFPIREISVETNPNHLTGPNLAQLRDMGVNRLSVGVQTFDDGILRTVERFHKYGSGEEIAARLKETMGYFDTLNVDMIFNFPRQTMAMLEHDLDILTGLHVDQVTFYPLMVSTSTERIMGKKLGKVDYDRGRGMYMKITDRLKDAYVPSTAWCFSRGDVMIDEYVVNYDEYAGLGSGSIGYLGGSVYSNTFDIPAYIEHLNNGQFPVAARKDCSTRERLLYDFLMKLFGISLDLDELSQKHGVNAYIYLLPEVTFFRSTGGLMKKDNKIVLTPKGQYYWVIMMREFFIAVNNFRDYCRSLID